MQQHDQRRPAIRLCVGGLLGLLVLLAVILGRPGGVEEFPKQPVLGDPGIGPWLTEGSDLIVQGRYKRARDRFRSAKAWVRSSRQRVPRTLEQVCGLWMSLERGPEQFRWEKAAVLLEKAQALPDLPRPLMAWLDRQDAEVAFQLKAQRALRDAEQRGAQAGDYVVSGRFDAAIVAYRQAIAAAKSVHPDSVFGARAPKLAERLRMIAYRAIVSEARLRAKAQGPNWGGCAALLAGARPFVAGDAQRAELQSLVDLVALNRRSVAAYDQATAIVNRRAVDQYRKAVTLMKQVDKRSRLYPDAQAYLTWVEADLAVRAAQRAYDEGDSSDAFTLLAEALQHDSLGPAARASVRTRRTRWGRVVRAYNRGHVAYQKSSYAVARREFERVIAAEPNTGNRFHVRSRDWLDHLRKVASFSLKKKLSAGHAALEAGRWAEAARWFGDVARDPDHRRRDLEAVRRAVAKVADDRRLLKAAERDFLYDRADRFRAQREALTLLASWLPRGHADAKEARALLTRVVQRLKAIEQQRRR